VSLVCHVCALTNTQSLDQRDTELFVGREFSLSHCALTNTHTHTSNQVDTDLFVGLYSRVRGS